MRTGATLFYSTTTTATVYAPLPAPTTTIQRSPWHSPVPYLFGGLAAMLGLIAFALLILACSYWKLSTQQSNGGDDAEKGESGSDAKASPVFEEKFLVIMAGDLNPTFLATPKCHNKINYSSSSSEQENEKEENLEQNDQTMVQENGETESEQHRSQQ